MKKEAYRVLEFSPFPFVVWPGSLALGELPPFCKQVSKLILHLFKYFVVLFEVFVEREEGFGADEA